LLHSPYGGKKKRLECWKAVEDAIDEGEVRTGGVSNFGVKHVCTSPFHTLPKERITLCESSGKVYVCMRSAANKYYPHSSKNSSRPHHVSLPP
jgi:aryl-alcohol dehydrogenase-like predicted oxidoreductase